MKRCATSVLGVLIAVMILQAVSSVDQALTAEANKDCPQTCNISITKMICTDCIPDNVPATVRDIVLDNLCCERLVAHRFCQGSWRNVEILTITSQFEEYGSCNIVDYSFDCLEEIEILKLSVTSGLTLNNNTFFGLINLRVLDLTNSIRLRIGVITTGLSLETNIPKLSKIILSNVGSVYEGIFVTQAFIDALAGRNVSEIDLSYSHVKFEKIFMDKLCENIKVFNVSNAAIVVSPDFPEAVCSSLQVVDISNSILPGAAIVKENPIIITHENISARFPEFFSALSKLFLNRLLSGHQYVYVYNSTLRFDPNSLRELHLSGYNMPVLELESITGLNRLQVFDLSDNRLEKITPKILASFVHLQRIDLSKNNLFSSNVFNETFANLFKNNLELRDANLASNGLSYLPTGIFLSNEKMEQFDISGNKMKQINFKIEHLLQLKYADFRNNAIEYLNKFSMKQIDMLYKNTLEQRDKTTGNKKFVIDLRNNPFSCECPSFDFIKWFVESPVFEESRSWYHCEIDEQHIPMNTEAVKAATEDCDKLRRKLLSIVLPSAGIVILVAISVLLYARYLRRKRHQRFEDVIDRIHNNNFEFRSPVFLSFASEDAEFVDLNVLRPLQAQLKILTDTDRDLVATGDRLFRLGRSIFAEIIQCLEESAAVVVVLSKNYCNSEYCQLEIEQARLMRKPIVIIMKEIVRENEMKAVIKEVFNNFTRATFRFDGEALKLQQDWEYISQCILQLL